MSGLLSGVLPAIYSAGDSAKRRLRGLLSDPVGEIQQTMGKARDDLNSLGELQRQAFADPKQPLKVTNPQAFGLLADKYMNSVMNFAPVAMAIDPKAQKRLVQGLLGEGDGQRYRLGDITRKQADEAYLFGGKPVGESVDVYVTPQIGQEHVKIKRVGEDGFQGADVGLFAKQAMRPNSEVIPPATVRDHPVLRSEQVTDYLTGKRYNAEMPLMPVDDGFEVISIIPQGLPPRKKPR